MVVFICNGCGSSLKKAQVDAHGNTCKKCQSISCIDCSKEFWGKDYQSHLKCITENEKYGGKNYKPKTAKGEVKQEQWTKKIQEVIDNMRKENPRIAVILQQLKNYDNIPRKKPKFMNFVKNSLKVLNEPIIETVWTLFVEATDNSVKSTEGQNETSENESANNKDKEDQNDVNENSKKKKKKSKKESVEDSVEINERTIGNTTEHNNKSNKRKRKICELIENTNAAAAEELAETIEMPSNKKRKKHKKSKEHHIGIENGVAAMEENIAKEILPIEETDRKMSLSETILAVLQKASNNEISLKKLKKKVLAKLISNNADGKNEKLLVKLNKKLKKMSNLKIENERIYLISK